MCALGVAIGVMLGWVLRLYVEYACWSNEEYLRVKIRLYWRLQRERE